MRILTLLLSRGLHLQCKTRELNRGRIRESQTIHCTNTTLVLKKKKNVCSLCHHCAFWALKAIAKFGVSHRSKYRVAFAIALHLALALLCNCYCCHDPFIVRSAQTCPPLIGCTQLSHLSRCSRSTLTTVCFCVLGLQSPSSCSGVWDPWSVEYQSCKPAMLL